MPRASGQDRLRAFVETFSLSVVIPSMSRSNRQRDCRTRDDAKSIVPAGTPDWITAELIEQTIRVWQPYYQAVVTPEEAITMIQTVGRLFQALSSGSSS
jgi:hypothetical protein